MKKALVIGINYTGTENQLEGCDDDARAIASMLSGRGYQVTTLLDADNPTKQRILSEIDKLVSSGADQIYFHYSGHGVRTAAPGQPEGQSSNIVPIDFKTAGYISDVELKSVLVDRLGPNQTLLASIDACHSGTALDLNWTLLPGKPVQKDTSSSTVTSGEVILFSAAKDNQTAGENSGTGFFTQAYINTLKAHGFRVSPSDFLQEISKQMSSSQTPQLSFSNVPNITADISI